MTWDYGSFTDMYRNEITLAPSSNARGGFWVRIKGDEQRIDKNDAALHLSVSQAKVFIALLKEAIEKQEED